MLSDCAYVWEERAGVRFSGEGANLVMLVFKVEKDDGDIFINFTSTRDVAFTRVNHTYVNTLIGALLRLLCHISPTSAVYMMTRCRDRK